MSFHSSFRASKPAPVVVAAASSFTTTFPLTENPFSQGGKFTDGLAVGLDWNNVKSVGGSPGVACAAAFVATGSDDCLAFYQGNGVSTTKHYAYFIAKVVGGYTPPDSQECGLYVGGTITAHNAQGYELGWGFGLNGPGPTRWNGTAGDFTGNGNPGWTDTPTFNNPFALVDGTRVDVVFDSTSGHPVISVWKDNAARTGNPDFQVADTSAGKFNSGSPGMGFFVRNGTGVDVTKACIKEWGCGNA